MAAINELCTAVWESRQWLSRFRRLDYAKAFREYCERFGPFYAGAVREADGDLNALQVLSDSILDELERGWKRRRFWERAAVRVEEKQVIVSFLSPMLLWEEDNQTVGQLGSRLSLDSGTLSPLLGAQTRRR